MGRDADAHEGRLPWPKCVDFCREFGEGFVDDRGIGAEDFLKHDAADARLEHGVERNAGIAGIRKCRYSGTHSFRETKTGGVKKLVAIEYGFLHGLETRDPEREIEILEESSERGEFEVRVRVHQTGHQNRIAQISRVASRRICRRPDVRDSSVVDCDDAILERAGTYG